MPKAEKEVTAPVAQATEKVFKNSPEVRQQRADDKRRQRAVEKALSENDWWEINKTYLEKKDFQLLQGYLSSQEEVKDQLYWMERGHLIDPNDPDFVSLQEGLEDLQDFNKEHPLCCLGRYKTPLAADKDTEIFQWASDEHYWANYDLLEFICKLSPSTKTYACYGILTAVPDWRYREFLQDVTDQFGNVSEKLWKNLQ
jgi:hypothetical protein